MRASVRACTILIASFGVFATACFCPVFILFLLARVHLTTFPMVLNPKSRLPPCLLADIWLSVRFAEELFLFFFA